MKQTKDAFLRRYPTQRARTVADAAYDKLPILTTTIAEGMRVWEHAYLSAGGVVSGGEHG